MAVIVCFYLQIFVTKIYQNFGCSMGLLFMIICEHNEIFMYQQESTGMGYSKRVWE